MLNINKKHLCLSIFIFAIGFLGSTQLLAQKKSKKKEKEPKENIWKERMWYGGGVSLALQSATLGNGVNGNCLLYTSDAADERSSVDLGGRRIIKKKKI